MTFEEFFKKKRIDLIALQQGEPTLFAEFKLHYGQMGEKSFDHTKKYWFNKIRRQYNISPEVKTEKPKIENQLAEQTVTEALSELAAPTPRAGFTPRFKAPVPPKLVEDVAEESKKETSLEEKPKVGFTPRFKAGVTKPVEMPVEEAEVLAEEKPAPVEDKPKVGFTPRFKAAMIKPVETPVEETKAEVLAEEKPTPVEDKPKVGFTPRFKAGVTKPVEAPSEEKKEDVPAEDKKAEIPSEEKPKVGFTPRFKAGVTKPAPPPAEE